MDGPASHKSLYWALGIGAVTFVIKMSSLSTASSNGALTSCSYTDFFALIAGAILFVFGLVRVTKSKDDATAKLLSVAVIVLGAVHVARGLGIIMSPCG